MAGGRVAKRPRKAEKIGTASKATVKATDEEWKPGDEFSVEVVKRNYEKLEDRIHALELKQYLELYLYPNLSSSASKELVLSVVLLTIEKHGQGLEPFSYLGDDVERFKVFFRLLVQLPDPTVAEKRARVSFLNIAFNSLEVATIRKVCLPYVHLGLWTSLSAERLGEELEKAPGRVRKQFSKLAAKSKDGSKKLEEDMLLQQLNDFVETVEEISGADAPGQQKTEWGPHISYLERTAELIIDLLSQLPTRRFFRPLLDDLQIVVRCRRAISNASRRDLFEVLERLLDHVDFYLEFEIDDHTGEPLSRESVVQRRTERVGFLQMTAFKMFRAQLEDLALTNHASIERRSSLLSHLRRLGDEDLVKFAAALRCVPKDSQVDRTFVEEAIVHRYCRRQTQAESFKREPLYPTEDLIWNSAVVPPSDFSFANRSLSLPKLNLQFLTMYDYLLRNYTLFRLESTSEIRDDLESVIKRMRPRLADEGQVVFDGWARMATSVKNIKIVEKLPPRLDSPSPKAVKCELEYDLRKLPLDARREWDETREHDVMFLVSIDVPEVAFGGTDETSKNFPHAHGVRYIRGLEVFAMLDADGKEVREWETGSAVYAHGNSPIRRLRAYLDPVQYFLDTEAGLSGKLYETRGTFNLLIRRKAKENNFKAVLETIRNLIASTETEAVVPEWLHDIFLGYGDPGAAAFYNLESSEEERRSLDFYDTFVSESHLRSSFPSREVQFDLEGSELNDKAEAYFKVEFADDRTVKVRSYDTSPIYRIGEKLRRNPVPFSPTQVTAIRAGMERGLTLIVGPPGTGKTDVAVQIVANLYRSYPEQRILIVTHSNHALNDIFEKIMQRDVDERHLLRLGQGEKALATEKSFSKIGRVNFMLQKRIDRLNEVSRLAASLGVEGDHGYTCETASLFFSHTVRLRWERFVDQYRNDPEAKVVDLFPFRTFFSEAPFSGEPADRGHDYEIARNCYDYLLEVFQELEECRSMELLRNNKDRGDYLLLKQARIIAMTCTHAAMRRDEFVRLGLQYDSLVMEEAGQVLEVETLIPMLLQKPESGSSSSPLKRVVLVGDHNQLPPVVKNPALQKYARMSQSLFSRFIRLGNPAISLDMQGRARSKLADLYRWRYDNLGDLDLIANKSKKEYELANPGFVHDFQMVSVGDENSESQPVPFFYQNIQEAEYIAAVYQYMRLLGYPAEKITVLTTYNGQKHLLKDVISARIQWNPSIGMPSKISTVDKYQGQQNDYVLLSLVRTRHVGHIRDVRRLVVAMSRARLGLYIFCREELFRGCVELAPSFEQLSKRPLELELRTDERYDPSFNRNDGDPGPKAGMLKIGSVEEMAHLVSTYAGQLDEFFRTQSDAMPIDGAVPSEEGKTVVAQE